MGILKKILVGVVAWEVGSYFLQLKERKDVFKKAKATAKKSGKPLLVVGNPYGQYGCGDVTLDLEKTGECENHVQASVERIPFSDKHFGCAYVSHIIEHTCNPKQALSELRRVADRVFIVYPRWWRLATWLVPGHTWIMYERDGEYVFKRIRERCNVPNYYGIKSGRAEKQAGTLELVRL